MCARISIFKIFILHLKVCRFKSLPDWLQDNNFIIEGNRPTLSSFKACLLSLFRLHTETGNIWTHRIGCLLFAFLAIYVLNFSEYSAIGLVDKIVFGFYFAGVITCLALSTCYHTMICHFHAVEKLFFKLLFI
jgi:adiponectin receptor